MQPTDAFDVASNPVQQQSPLSANNSEGYIANDIPDGAVASPRGIARLICQRNASSATFAGASGAPVPTSRKCKAIGHENGAVDGHLDARQVPEDHPEQAALDHGQFTPLALSSIL